MRAALVFALVTFPFGTTFTEGGTFTSGRAFFPDGGSRCDRIITAGLLPTTTQGTNDYINLTDHTKSSVESSESTFRVPINMKAHDLHVFVDTAPGGTDTWKTTLRDDAADTTLTCTITGTETECFDDEEVPSIDSGSILTLVVDSSDGPTAPTFGSFVLAFCLDEA